MSEEKKHEEQKPVLVKAELECVGKCIGYQLTDPAVMGPRESPALATLQLLLPSGHVGVLFVDSRLAPYLGAAYKVKVHIDQIGQSEAMEFLGMRQFPNLKPNEKGVVV